MSLPARPVKQTSRSTPLQRLTQNLALRRLITQQSLQLPACGESSVTQPQAADSPHRRLAVQPGGRWSGFVPNIQSGHRGRTRDRLRNCGIEPNSAPEVLWNFEKFPIGRDGRVIERFEPDIAADDPRLVTAVDRALAQPA
ncbi:thioredoxin domain-containing protein [Peristeroidobacter soli]|uniref:hypothetical protein n=1 Tax=Peristeroidobacter soli TaxID=2497877 RepID=UPI00101CCCD3|nr:hypothetical protein [Peristeroidobacter soli]